MADKFIRERQMFGITCALRISNVAVLAQCLEMHDRGGSRVIEPLTASDRTRLLFFACSPLADRCSAASHTASLG